MLRRIFGPKKDEVTRKWRKPHNEELSDLYSSPNTVRVIKSRRMISAGHIGCMGKRGGVYRVLVGKPEGNRPRGSRRRRWGVILKWIFRKMGCGDLDWIDLAQDGDSWRALVNAVMNLRVP